MAYFPFFVEVKNKKCCIVGGGVVAYRKIIALLEYEADITVISPVFCEEIKELASDILMIPRAYREQDIEDAFFVIAATDDPETNSAISKACMERNILVNVVDVLEKCNFLFPAYVKRGSISIGVTTSGKSPVMAGYMKNAIQEILPDFYENLVETLGGYREYIKENVDSVEKRSTIFKKLAIIGLEHEGRVTQSDVDALIKDNLF